MKVFLNGRLMGASHAHISVFDHGFLYGDGIYETVHVAGRRIVQWPAHFHRLKSSARGIALACPWASAHLEKAVLRLVRANHQAEASVRITVSRGAGPLGLNPKLCAKPTLAMMLHPTRPVERWRRRGVSIAIVDIRRNHPRCLDPRIKSNSSLNAILARMEADRVAAFEAILLNLNGDLTEGTTSTIFFVRRGRLFTPALSCGLLEGVTRGDVIAVARSAGIPVKEGRYAVKDLRAADEVFLASTTLEMMPVTSLIEGGRGTQPRRATSIGSGRPGPLTGRLHQLLKTAVL